MKFLKTLLLLTVALSIITNVMLKKAKKSSKGRLRKHREVQLVTDKNGFNSNIEHVVRRTPSVNTVNRLGAGRLEPESRVVYSQNSNTSNGPNIGWFGRKAEIVGKNYSFNLILILIRTPYCYA
jgi:hypothetical protein